MWLIFIKSTAKIIKEASDNKNAENIPPIKFNFNRCIFSSLLSSGASLTIFGADFVSEVKRKVQNEPPPPDLTFRIGQSLTVSHPGTFPPFGGGGEVSS